MKFVKQSQIINAPIYDFVWWTSRFVKFRLTIHNLHTNHPSNNHYHNCLLFSVNCYGSMKKTSQNSLCEVFPTVWSTKLGLLNYYECWTSQSQTVYNGFCGVKLNSLRLGNPNLLLVNWYWYLTNPRFINTKA